MNTNDFQAPAGIQKNLEDFLGGEQTDDKVRKIWEKVAPLLIPGEQVEHLLVQNMAAMKLFPGALVLTNRRAIGLQPGMLKMSFIDLLWRNLHKTHLVEHTLGSELTFQHIDGSGLRIEHLPKVLSRPAYAFAQSLEEAALEFRRNRALEETRAAARGVLVGEAPRHAEPAPAPTLATAPIEPPPAGAQDPSASLSTLKALLDQGLIEEGEYQAKKAEVLARL